MSQAQPVTDAPAVGALFDTTGSGRLTRHFCSASVVDSPGGNLILTAAHCVDGQTDGRVVFVPGYHSGHAPYGAWTVERVITGSGWRSAANPDEDFAFLQVRKPGSAARVQDVTGGERLGVGLPPRQLVAAIAYPNRRNAPIRCLNFTLPFGPDQLRFDCAGYTGGSSGGPLLADVSPASGLGTVIGVIGGYQEGGDTDAVSYAARFGAQAAALYRAAAAGR